MSDPCAGEGATHYACPCFLERLREAEAWVKRGCRIANDDSMACPCCGQRMFQGISLGNKKETP